ncbi:helix-turn-helix domain-containing protein, partial [uncultured Thiodictyon sp.]|uniref:helix-turn-helix domain-containing protein n=1 Tax=uncultured Thiodictyon sp. TaxID=1846217 RepID=UPI0025CCF0BB
MQLTLEQAADRLGKSVRQVRYLIQSGVLPAAKTGGRRLIAAAAFSFPRASSTAVKSSAVAQAPGVQGFRRFLSKSFPLFGIEYWHWQISSAAQE